ncbi:MAG TPA: DUF6504 family protein [Ornithinimicrobium sp.]|uniref:DUF6504 family protein n=1 Tax=Ornithinimicrobium sp. TaxID=1977084 RepID=UPI002B49578E|nr:DUF6504 family protein [Ornithinimicrobium sp.]HKJ12109.1 DUF6504 family protein [Ornithinimicrobium sp.]
MGRQYHERIEVRCGEPMWGSWSSAAARSSSGPGPTDATPTAFVWRGRLHVVRAVVAQWTQRLPWWQAAGQDTTSARALEQQVWRVEASVGSMSGTGVYDLAHGEHWRLLRVAD